MSEEAAVEAAAADGRDFVTAEDVQAAQPQDRPEWLPEKFKTPEDLAKSYTELQSKLGSKDEDIRSAILEEIQNEALTGLSQRQTISYQILLTRIKQLIMTYCSGGRAFFREWF